MARTFSAALFLAAFRSNFYAAEFWDGVSPLSPSTPSPRTEAAFAVEAVYYYHKGTQVIANTVCACAAVENRQSGACRLPDAGRTHPRMSPR